MANEICLSNGFENAFTEAVAILSKRMTIMVFQQHKNSDYKTSSRFCKTSSGTSALQVFKHLFTDSSLNPNKLRFELMISGFTDEANW